MCLDPNSDCVILHHTDPKGNMNETLKYLAYGTVFDSFSSTVVERIAEQRILNELLGSSYSKNVRAFDDNGKITDKSCMRGV